MNIDRLKHLAEVARSIPDEKFRMRGWGEIDLEKPIEIAKLPEIAVPVVCHTSACLLGWAAFDPQFNAEGLRWQKRPLLPEDGSVETCLPLHQHYEIACNEPLPDYRYKSSAGHNEPFVGNFLAGCAFFDLTEEEGDRLFIQGRTMNGAKKAAQIEEMFDAHS